jgi:hypothetical protein
MFSQRREGHGVFATMARAAHMSIIHIQFSRTSHEYVKDMKKEN